MSLSRRASLRDLFRSRSRSNLQEIPPAPSTPYVPLHAAAGFSRTVIPRRPVPFQSKLPATKEEASSSADNSSTSDRRASRLIQPGHLYLDFPPEMDLDAQPRIPRKPLSEDYAAFIAAARAHDDTCTSPNRSKRLSLAVPEGSSSSPSPSPSPSPSREFVGGGLDNEFCAPAPGGKTLRKRRSLMVFGQRIAEYVRPGEKSPVSPGYMPR